MTPVDWAGLLEAAGLEEITFITCPVDNQQETRGILERYRTLGMLRLMGRMLLLYARSPAYRKFVQVVRQGGVIPDLTPYFTPYFGLVTDDKLWSKLINVHPETGVDGY